MVDYERYHRTITEMEKAGVHRDYIQGWIGGYMGNPKREQQRVTEAYEQGYAHGTQRNTSGYGDWVQE